MHILKQIKNNFQFFITLNLGGGESIGYFEGEEKPKEEIVLPEIDSLQKELEGLDATKKYVSKAGSYLSKQLSPEDYNDPEAKQTIELLEGYKIQFKESVKNSENITIELNKLQSNIQKLEDNYEFSKGIDIDSNGEKTENIFSTEELKTISNREFLSLPDSERLQYVTKNNVDSENISGGNIKSFEISFDIDGDGEINNELFVNTTAGQVIPDEVRSVSSGGIEWKRQGISGEYFSENGERLKIYNETEIDIVNLITTKELETLEVDLINDNIDYEQGTVEYTIATNTIKNGIEPEFAVILLNEEISGLSEKEANIEIELVLTEIARIQGRYNLNREGDKYDNESALRLFYNLDSENYEENAKDYGISEDEITKKESMSEYFNFKDIQGLNDIADRLDVPKNILYAIFNNETAGKGLGKAMPRFEQHVFDDYIGNIPENEAIMMATSYGGMQIMGFNYEKAGYNSVQELKNKLTGPDAETQQLNSFASFLKNTPGLISAMQNYDYHMISTLYNGKGYKQNNYDTKLKNYVNNNKLS